MPTKESKVRTVRVPLSPAEYRALRLGHQLDDAERQTETSFGDFLVSLFQRSSVGKRTRRIIQKNDEEYGKH